MNTYGNKFKITVFGGSHEKNVGVEICGIPAGISICEDDFAQALHRRSFGEIPFLSFATTPRKEEDRPVFMGGIADGMTTGENLTIIFENKNFNSSDYQKFRSHPRPSHADFAASVKYNGLNNQNGGGVFSGRMTVALVAAGVVASKYICSKLNTCKTDSGSGELNIKSFISSIGGLADSGEWEGLLSNAKQEGDSLGGEVECTIEGLPVGVGEPFFNSLESEISRLAFSVPGVKGIFFGDYSDFPQNRRKASCLKGSEFNDLITDATGHTSTNHSGGINGGISNGNPVVFTLDIRPTSSIRKPQRTFNFESGKPQELLIGGRHDVCIALRCPVIAESIASIAIANLI